MRRSVAALAGFLGALLPLVLYAEDPRRSATPHSGKARRFAITCPVRDLAPPQPSGKETRPLLTVVASPEVPHPQAPASTPNVPAPAKAQSPPTLTNPIVAFDGLSNADNLAAFGFEVIPASTNIGVGPNHIVQGTNFLYHVYDKSGNPLTAPFKASELFAGLGPPCEDDDGDPIVHYDALANRWVISQFGFQSTTAPPWGLCFAVSQTPDPTGAYFLYDFPKTDLFPNLPQTGVWPDAYYMTTIQFAGGITFAGSGAYAFDRLAMLDGDPNASFVYFNVADLHPNLFGGLPSNLQGLLPPAPGTPNLFAFPVFPNGIGLFEFLVNFQDPARSTFIELPESPLVVAGIDVGNPTGTDDIEQPGVAATSYLESAPGRLMHSLSARQPGFVVPPADTPNLFLEFAENVSGVTFPTTAAAYQAGVRWMELHRNPSPGGPWAIHDQGTLNPSPGDGANGPNCWNSSIVQDNQGNMAIGYNVSSTSIYPSARYTGRLTTDPPGTLGTEVTARAGSGSQQTTASRWGDYSMMVLDPDGCTFWNTLPYMETSSNAGWKTWIYSFKHTTCTPPPMGTVEGTVTDCRFGGGATGGIRLSDGHSIPVDSNGHFSETLPPGTYVGVFSGFDYGDNAIVFTVIENQITTVEFCATTEGSNQGLQGAAQFLIEGCGPPNGAADPGETVTADLCLTNTTGTPTADLTGVLYPTGGVIGTPGPKKYGVIGASETVCRPFKFTTNPSLAAGVPLLLNLQLTGGATSESVTVPLIAGVPIIRFTEDLEGITPPALPPGFTASNGPGDPVLWQTTASSPLGSNALFVDNPAVASDKVLEFPPVTVNSGTLYVSFNHSSNLEHTFDGGVLEISINGGPFQDALEAGGTFVTGGYNSIISPSYGSPLAGRPAWSGDHYAAIEGTTMSSPQAAGAAAVLRLRMASDSTGSGNGPTGPAGANPAGWWVDDIRIWDGGAVCAPVGTGLDVDAHAIAGSSSNQNQVLEPGEDVQLGSFQVNGTPNPLPLTGTASNFTGPAGASYVIVDPTADYGAIPGNAPAAPAATNDCFAASGDCYVLGVSNPSPRPAAHWDATFDEALSSGGSKTWTLHVGGSFADVPTTNLFYRFIETIFHNSITGGCAAGSYCPGNATLRKQMAVFVLKAVEGATYLPPPATGVFNDVPVSDPFAPWIEELFRRGVVAGCATPGGPNYCPDNPVQRQQMAVFLLRTKLGSGYVPPPCQGLFGDVACPSLFAAWIEDLYHRSITGGCQASPLLYCGASSVTRGQMAVFLTKAFGLLLHGP